MLAKSHVVTARSCLEFNIIEPENESDPQAGLPGLGMCGPWPRKAGPTQGIVAPFCPPSDLLVRAFSCTRFHGRRTTEVCVLRPFVRSGHRGSNLGGSSSTLERRRIRRTGFHPVPDRLKTCPTTLIDASILSPERKSHFPSASSISQRKIRIFISNYRHRISALPTSFRSIVMTRNRFRSMSSRSHRTGGRRSRTVTAEWRNARGVPGAPVPTLAASNNRLLRNRGSEAPGYFQDVTEAAGVAMDQVAVEVNGPAYKGAAFGFAPVSPIWTRTAMRT